MKAQHRLLALAIIAASFGASAQTTMGTSTSTGYDASRPSWMPYTNNGYVGLNLGQPRYTTSCGAAPGLTCGNPHLATHLYAGGMFNSVLGGEIGYINMGRADRAGGTTRAEGINLALVAQVPATQAIGVFGKLGATYGHTTRSSAPAALLTGGGDNGWGPSIAAGVNWNFNNNWTAVLEWERHRFNFGAGQRDYVRATSLGLKYRF